MNFGFYSYLASAVAFIFFTVLLATNGLAGRQGKLLLGVIAVQAVWALLAAQFAHSDQTRFGAYYIFETLRYPAWYLFFLAIIRPDTGQSSNDHHFLRRALALSVAFGILVLVGEFVTQVFLTQLDPVVVNSIGIVGHIFLAIIGLAIIEQLYRNTSARNRPVVKYLYIGVGAIFAFDLFLYSQALLFHGIDREIWESRGVVNALMVPLLAITAARNNDWDTNIFVSRHIVLSTTAILGAGLYLMLMAAAGFYIKEYGGDWGRVAQVLFLSLALLLLAAVMLSGRVRAQARVFLGKHFYKNKYDYRQEWLRLTQELEDSHSRNNSYDAVIQSFAHMVEARAGSLWLRDQYDRYENVAAWNQEQVDTVESATDGLVAFLQNTGYVINLLEIDGQGDEYKNLTFPEWVSTLHKPWLIIPLNGLDTLIGFVVLANPLIVRSINWEDRDLLKTAAKQVSSYLTVIGTSEALAQARQFEVFNRLSAYMVHDLKNIAAELQLIARNADKHRDNPEFLVDAFDSVKHAASDIGKLLDQLRGKDMQSGKKVAVDLCQLLQTVIDRKQSVLPVPELETPCKESFVLAEKDRLLNVLMHLVENAQQATPETGYVRLLLSSGNPVHVISIRDSGSGMDDDFIRNRLFSPFDTTKGNAGMGIGMYESREFIHQLGGEIIVKSRPGQGTLVELKLQAHEGIET